ncbi:MAG: hypothetical protein IJA19_00190, partial [Clostridia bacterium]|nr:hypothetical protein [Clostridia bacterium]
MENLNVFELTSELLSENTKTAKKSQKALKESVEPIAKKEVNKIPANKIRLESVRIAEDVDDVDYEPNDEVVLIVDPSMEEEPATE